MTSKTTITARTCTRCDQPFPVAIESDRDVCARCIVDNKEVILKKRECGWTYQAIANLIGMSRQRVHQIVNKENYCLSKNKRRRELYRYARMKGFTSQESNSLKGGSKKIIDQLVVENG